MMITCHECREEPTGDFHHSANFCLCYDCFINIGLDMGWIEDEDNEDGGLTLEELGASLLARQEWVE